MNLNEHTTQIILAIIGLLTTGFIIKFIVNKIRIKASNKVNIKNNNVNGDIAGRDIKKD